MSIAQAGYFDILCEEDATLKRLFLCSVEAYWFHQLNTLHNHIWVISSVGEVIMKCPGSIVLRNHSFFQEAFGL